MKTKPYQRPTYKPKPRPNTHGRRAQASKRPTRIGMDRYHPSVLGPHKEDLRQWFAIEMPFDDILERLKKKKVKTTKQALSKMRQRMQREQLQEIVLDRIATGAAAHARVTKELGANPAPAIQTLIALIQNLIFTITTAGRGFMNIEDVTGLMRPVLEWVKIQEKREDRALDREKFEAAQRTKIESGLDAIESEVKGNPEAARIFAKLRTMLLDTPSKATA